MSYRDRRSSVPHKRSIDDRSENHRASDSDPKRNRNNPSEDSNLRLDLLLVEIDSCKIQIDSLPKHLKYWYESDKDSVSIIISSSQQFNQSKLYDQAQFSLCCSIRKLEFELFLTDLEVNKWSSQLASMEQNLKEVE